MNRRYRAAWDVSKQRKKRSVRERCTTGVELYLYHRAVEVLSEKIDRFLINMYEIFVATAADDGARASQQAPPCKCNVTELPENTRRAAKRAANPIPLRFQLMTPLIKKIRFFSSMPTDDYSVFIVEGAKNCFSRSNVNY